MVWVFVTGNDSERRGDFTMCDWYASISGNGDGRTDARHNLKRNVHSLKGQRLFAAAPEDERVAAFEAYHSTTKLRMGDKQGIDLLLFHGVATGTFTDKNEFRVGMCFLKNGSVDEPIIHHNIGLAQTAYRLECEQFRVAGSRTDEVDFAT